MYNSINLPLSFKKVWKKSISSLFRLLFPAVIFGTFFIIIFMRDSTDHSSEPIYNMLLFLVGLYVISFAIKFIYEYFYYKTYYYNFDDNGAEIRKGVISRATGHVRYDRLQNIFIDQDILDRIFGLYDVHYETAGETSGFYSHVDGLEKENADKLVTFLIEKSNRNNQNLQANGVEKITQNLAEKNQEIIPDTKAGDNKEISSDFYKLSPAVIFVRILFVAFYLFLIIFGTFGKAYSRGSILTGNNFVVFLQIAILILIISFIYNYVWYKNFYFKFSNDKGEIRTKVIAQSVSYIYYDRIQNINIKQGILDRFFGIYRILVETAGERSGSSLVLYGYKNNDAQEIRNFLLEKADKFKTIRI